MRHPDTVYLLDASIYIFRAWFGIPDHFHDESGRPVNAVYGYLKNLISHLDELKPYYMLAAFDESLFSGFRHTLYPDYKANRALPDEALSYQLALCKLLTEQLGICSIGHETYEADDLIAWAADSARKEGLNSVVISRDKDLAQLVEENDLMWDWSDDQYQDYERLTQRWGIPLNRLPDLLALVGDAVDSIPGIKGIGDKSALALLQKYGDLETLYCNLDEVLTLPIRGAKRIHSALQNTQEQALLFRQLIRLHYPDTPIEIETMKIHSVDKQQLRALIQELGLGDRFQNLADKYL